ncbi:hypothetical protein C8D92_11211 [Tamilnaduibacter salinus]|uniref:Uncharacterized protein n=1 Tax=Tamilnaduibacter salinus TaxID=1484056 RepID=A0A2U1CTA6_9GAMM|nr:hypothetical protein [Tamilnaduibacter salinus]PVY69609.1 hypothetical protein C8D92_11211 [Tamilnaduibacter salinus]
MRWILFGLFSVLLLAGCKDRVIWNDNGRIDEATENRDVWDSNGKMNSGDRRIWNDSNGEPVVE